MASSASIALQSLPSIRARGWAKSCSAPSSATARSSRAQQLNLEIKETNYALLKRYHRYGYKCFHVEQDFYADGWGAIRMKKRFAV